MKVETHILKIKTKGEGTLHNLTDQVAEYLQKVGMKEGNVLIFCTGSTGAVSTIEFEPGLQKDFPAAMERFAPSNMPYAHHETWHDDNGRSHVKATLMGPSLVVPFNEGALLLGTWQQIVFCEWDTHSRERSLVLQFTGS